MFATSFGSHKRLLITTRKLSLMGYKHQAKAYSLLDLGTAGSIATNGPMHLAALRWIARNGPMQVAIAHPEMLSF